MRRNGRKKVRAGGRHSGAPVLASVELWNCAVTQEALRPSCGTRRNRTPASRLYGFCGSDNSHDNPCCYLTSLLLPSVPFPSGSFAAHPPREGVWERVGKEWVIDKSLLDFVFSYLYLYFIASDYPTTEMPTTEKRARHVYLCLALYHPYRTEAGVIVLTSKVVNR